MKTTTSQKAIIASSVAAVMLSQAMAIEAPTDNSPPPANQAATAKPSKDDKPAAAPAENPRAYLGLMTDSAPEMLAEHLGLKNGEGLAIASLSPDGPAAKAGLNVNDIITKLNGKPLHSHNELVDAVNQLKPNDKIQLEVIQKGKTANLDVTLGTRPANLDRQLRGKKLDRFNMPGIPEDVKKMLENAEIEFDVAPNMPEGMQEQLKKMQKMAEEMNGAGDEGNPQQNGMFKMNAMGMQSKVMIQDPEGSIELENSNNGKIARVRDKDKKVTWSGAWDTEQDKAAAPPEIRKRIEALHLEGEGGMLKLQLGPNGLNAGPKQPSKDLDKDFEIDPSKTEEPKKD